LRNNHGGSDLVGMALLSHLDGVPLNYYRRRSSIVKPVLKSKRVGAFYEIEGKGPWTGSITPASQLYRGTVYLLMNGYSVSAAGEFAGHLRNIGHAVFIGEEAGGNAVTFIGGENLDVDLPHSHVRCTIPLHLIEMNVNLKNTGHGVIPDYELRPTVTDILQGRDIEMEMAMKLIGNR
jgi:C-terminal processing protease CtpA/Prc